MKRAAFMLLSGATALLLGCSFSHPMETAHGPMGIGHGDAYVAMGSSFAAGPGIGRSADSPPTRCARSADNYAHILARKLNLRLVDVSCSGATTKHILGPWTELPPQIDAVKADTALVTITIGGNDVNYIGSLIAASCNAAHAARFAPGGQCPDGRAAPEQEWANLYSSLRNIIAETRIRSPKARLVFVDYLTVVPRQGACEATPLSSSDSAKARAVARRLARLTEKAAKDGGAELLRASQLSEDHGACSRSPWTTGFPRAGGPAFMPYHPNVAGMSAIAEALGALVSMPPIPAR